MLKLLQHAGGDAKQEIKFAYLSISVCELYTIILNILLGRNLCILGYFKHFVILCLRFRAEHFAILVSPTKVMKLSNNHELSIIKLCSLIHCGSCHRGHSTTFPARRTLQSREVSMYHLRSHKAMETSITAEGTALSFEINGLMVHYDHTH